jgi:uncharacterized membrane protein
MRSRFSLNGHPFHPMLVTLPIGLLVWAFVSDLIYLGSGRDHMWYDMSFGTGIAAIVTALVAALPGFGDYFTMAIRSTARMHATVHMLLNLGVVALFVAAAVVMLDDGAVEGSGLTIMVVLHGLGVGLVTLSGVLGGEMVYRHHLAVIPQNSEVPDQEASRHVTHGGRHVEPR